MTMKAERTPSLFLRFGLAFLVAPIFGVLVGAVASWLFLDVSTSSQPLMPFMIYAGCFYAYPIALFLGGPIHLFLVHRKISSLTVYTLLGAAIGTLIALPYVAAGQFRPSAAVFPLVSAMTAAAMFWRIAVPPSEGVGTDSTLQVP